MKEERQGEGNEGGKEAKNLQRPPVLMPYGRKTQVEKTVSLFLSLYVAERTKKGDFTSKVQGEEEDGARLKKEEMGRRLLCTHRRIMGRNDPPPPPPPSRTSLLDICLLADGRGAAAHIREATMIFLQHKKHLLLGSSSIGGDLRRLQLRAEATSILQFSPPLPHSIARKTTLSPSRLCTQDASWKRRGGRICFFSAPPPRS